MRLAVPGSLAGVLFGAVAVATAADPPPLVTDRPDVTESSETVRRGLVQVEAGFLFSRFDNGGQRLDLTAFPLTLVRVGLDDRVELRFDWAGYLGESRSQNGVRTEDTGSGNLTVGTKIKLREESHAWPRLALLVDALLPTGSQSFRADRIEPRVRLAGSHTLSDRLSLGYNAGIGSLTIEEDSGDLDTRGLGRYSVSLAIGLAKRWGTFVEVFGFLPTQGGPAHSLDAGFVFLSSRTVQLDVSGGVGLNDRAEDWFVGTGVSFRLPR